MAIPQMTMLCATLSSIVKNRETENYERAIDILWELYEAVPDIVPFESFANIMIDLQVLVCCLVVLLNCLQPCPVDLAHHLCKLYFFKPLLWALKRKIVIFLH